MATRESGAAASALRAALFWAACGGLQSLAFAASPVPWVAWVGWIPTAWLALHAARSQRRGRVVLAAWWSGLVFWLCTIPWIAHTISVHGGLPTWLGVLLLGLLAAYMATYQAAFVAIAGRLAVPRNGATAWIGHAAALAGLWAGLEWLRERLLSGFPWAPLGEAMASTPGALDLAPWMGGRGLSMLTMFWSVVCARLLAAVWRSRARVADSAPAAETLRERRSAQRLWGATAVAMILLFLIAGLIAERGALGWTAVQPGSEQSPAGAGTRSIRVVQPNVPILRDGAEFVRNYQRLVELSQCPRPGALVVWPESAAFPYLWERHRTLREDVREIVSAGCELLFNSAVTVDTEEGPAMTNAALLASWVDGQVAVQRYDKMHLVPYGEYVPLKDALPFVRQLARSVGEFEPGQQLRLPQWRDVDVGVSICFEIVFPYEVAQRARAGADMLAVLTNDAWFGRSAAPAQHLVAARLRAAETRRPLVFAATTGVSAVVDERGRVLATLPLQQHGALDLVLEGDRAESPVTLYARAPWAVDGLAALLIVVGFAGTRQRGADHTGNESASS